jgi:hypothetical protein
MNKNVIAPKDHAMIPTALDRPGLSFCDLKVEIRPIETLKPFSRNARTHSEKQIQQIPITYAPAGCGGPRESGRGVSVRLVARIH